MNIPDRIQFLSTANRELVRVHDQAGRLSNHFDTVNEARENIEYLEALVYRAQTLLETLKTVDG